jgi:hypothetical protein
VRAPIDSVTAAQTSTVRTRLTTCTPIYAQPPGVERMTTVARSTATAYVTEVGIAGMRIALPAPDRPLGGGDGGLNVLGAAVTGGSRQHL